MRMPESEVKAEHSSFRRRRFVPVDPEEVLLREVMRRSLTMMESDTWRLCPKNAKALLLKLEVFECLVREKKTTTTKATCHAKE
ncbi:hypothetical protein D1007_55339 [Hordeum vulgare]|nr:hypothetical protein D1007_55339 [Hordeum vulgare]